jgi:cyanophycinase-like exopeptidase
MILRLILLSILFSASIPGDAQNFTSFMTGDSSDVLVDIQPGLILAGGGTDNNNAMRWMLRRAQGGDVLVLRASGNNGYNNYLFSQLGVAVNSVETIVFGNRAASFDPYVIRRIMEAEIIFIAGGDQTVYFEYWKDTPVAELLNEYTQNRKKIIGGTSAGMMILTDLVYLPVSSGVTSSEALGDPYHSFTKNLNYTNFIGSALFQHTFFESHFDQRNRGGRLMTFMARASKDSGIRARAIACNEVTALCIDENDIAYVFGAHPQYPDFVYFLEANCEADGNPQTVLPQTPLHWVMPDKRAVIVQKMAGKTDGSLAFDLKLWRPVNTADIEYWQVSNGVLEKESATDPKCSLISSLSDSKSSENVPQVSPNPTNGLIQFPESDSAILFDINGVKVLESRHTNQLDTAGLKSGIYILHLEGNQGKRQIKIIVSR